MRMFMRMNVLMFVLVNQMNIELRSRDCSSLLPRHVHVELMKPKLLQFMFEIVGIQAKIQHRADEHVAADAAENIEIERFHLASFASALIWLAA